MSSPSTRCVPPLLPFPRRSLRIRLTRPLSLQLVANIDITTAASDWLWAVFAVMGLSAIALLVLGHATRPIGERAFHELAAALCFTASIA